MFDKNGFLILVPQVRILPGAPIISNGYRFSPVTLFFSLRTFCVIVQVESLSNLIPLFQFFHSGIDVLAVLVAVSHDHFK